MLTTLTPALLRAITKGEEAPVPESRLKLRSLAGTSSPAQKIPPT